MKKINVLFVLSVLLSASCASVKARQSLPLQLAKGCYYADQGGIGESGNYLYVNGAVFDAGRFYMQVAQGNALITIACSEAAMMANYSELYKAYMKDSMGGGGNEDLKKDVANTKQALGELNKNVADLAIVAGSQQAAAPQGKAPAPGKPGKGASQTAAPVPAYVAPQAPPQTTAPQPEPAATTPIDPTLVGKIKAAKNRSELANILWSAALADSGRKAFFESLAKNVGNGADPDITNDKKTLIEAFGG